VREAIFWLIGNRRDAPEAPLPRGPAWVVLLVSIVSILAIDAVDYLTHGEFHLDLFYVLPVGAIAWWHGRGAAMTVGVLTAIAWYLTDRVVGQQHGHALVPVFNALIRVAFFAWVAHALDRMHCALERERWLASRDALTEVLNGRAFYAALDQEIQRSRRYGSVFSIAYLDVDHFKEINDRLGHQAGDDVLREIAATLLRHTRTSDTVARVGGDEFAILLPESDAASAYAVVEKLRSALRDAGAGRATVSMGVATFERPPRDLNEALKRADAMMYESKRGGRDMVRLEVASVR
jgi:diguanylate cyclase (GGDEF)-like protein